MSKVEPTVSNQEPHDDEWHYLDDRNEKHTENYIEWKYFNFIQKDLAGYIIYYILDPEQKTKIGGGRLLIRILKDGVSYGLIKKIDMSKVEMDPISASIRMDTAKIIEKSSYEYQITSLASDVSWSLDYKQKAPSIDSFKNVNPGFMSWEKVNWLVKMPKAEVKGDIKIGQDVFHIDGFGYSDTNWGELVPLFSKYEWGQYNDQDFSFVFGMLYKLGKIKSIYFYLVFGEHLVKIEEGKCEVQHTKWERDKIIGIKIPSESTFYVKSGEYEVIFSTKLLYHDSPGINLSPFLPKVVVSEQIVEYDGLVKKNGEIIHKFKGKGFQEWSGKTWKKVPVPF